MSKITLFNLIFRFFPGEYVRLPFYLPYGCLCLISVLKQAGHTVDFRDYQSNDYTTPTKIEHMMEFLDGAEDIIAISCLAKELPYAVLLSYELKRKYPHKKIILGGNAPSGVAGRLIEEFPFIDFVVIGEGDITITELLREIEGNEDYSSVKGIAFRKKGEVIVTPGRERIEDLDSLPLPAYEHVNMDLYEELYLSCVRGCPFRCTFCSQSGFWKGKMIKRGEEKIFEELDLLVKYKPGCAISLSDNIFCHKKEDLKKFYEEYKKRNCNFKIKNMCRRIDDVDMEILDIARGMNCEAMFYGVESGSKEVLKKIKKTFNVDVKEILIKTANKMKTFASFIFNFPFETIHDFLDTMNFIYDLLYTTTAYDLIIHLHFLAPIAGTEMIEEYGSELIYREFANILTTGRAMENYDRWKFPVTNKSLLMPILLEVKTHPSEIRNLVLEYKDIFPSYYIYRSVDMETKEKFLKCLYTARYSTDIIEYFFIHKDYRIFLAHNRFYIVSKKPRERDNALYVTLNEDNFAVLETFAAQNREKRIFIEPQFDTDYRGEAGRKIIEIFEKFIKENIPYTLMKPLPADISDSIGKKFVNIDSCENCPSMFSVCDETLIYCGGVKGKNLSFYNSRGDIYKEFLKSRKDNPDTGKTCVCPPVAP